MKEETIRQINREAVSVCMASYNGAFYIKQQIESILPQLGQEDELIIVDDCSVDNTIEIISSIPDNRIQLHRNISNKGVVKTFEEAVRLAKNEFVFLADQDDIWTENRVDRMLQVIKNFPFMLVTGNFISIDEQGKRLDIVPASIRARDSGAYAWNIYNIFRGKSAYYGCAMAFKRELKEIILPFPEYMESHDAWIAMAANLLKSNIHLEYIVLKHRLHNNNVTKSHRSLGKKLYSRILFARAMGELTMRITKYRMKQGDE